MKYTITPQRITENNVVKGMTLNYKVENGGKYTVGHLDLSSTELDDILMSENQEAKIREIGEKKMAEIHDRIVGEIGEESAEVLENLIPQPLKDANVGVRIEALKKQKELEIKEKELAEAEARLLEEQAKDPINEEVVAVVSEEVAEKNTTKATIENELEILQADISKLVP